MSRPARAEFIDQNGAGPGVRLRVHARDGSWTPAGPPSMIVSCPDRSHSALAFDARRNVLEAVSQIRIHAGDHDG